MPSKTPAFDKSLPHSPDAERAVLGAILIRNECLFRIGNLSADHFHKDENRIIFRTIALMREEHDQSIEPLTLKEALIRRGLLDLAGGVAYISSLLDMVPDVANVERYAKIVERAAKKRANIEIGNRLMRSEFDPETEPEDNAAAAMASLGSVATREEAQARDFVQVLSDALDAQARRCAGVLDDVALTSGYAGLDAVRAIKRSLVIVGAPSEAGKTTHLINLWDGLARNGHPAAFFTLESTEEEVALRYASMKGAIPHSYVQDFKLMGDDREAYVRRLRQIGADRGAPMFITRKLRTVDEIYLECRRLRAMEGIDAVLIDYVQRVRTPGFRPSEKEAALSHVAETFLDMAIDLNIGVIAASQLRDDWTKRESGRLVKEDLKYARALGETARVVLMFHRPRAVDKSNRDLKWCQVVYQIEKNSENRTDDPPMHMDEVTQRFSDGDCFSNNCGTVRHAERQLFA